MSVTSIIIYTESNCHYLAQFIIEFCILISGNPTFTQPITNETVAVGREAILACQVEDLGQYKVSKFIKHAQKLKLLEIIRLKPQTATYGFCWFDPSTSALN